MHKMKHSRTFSSPELVPPPSSSNNNNMARPADDHSLEGIQANVKLLLKLIQDHNEASSRDQDDRKSIRVAGMMTILDDVKTRIQRSQPPVKRPAELRRCNTDLRQRNGAPRGDIKPDKVSAEMITDEKDKLKRELGLSLAAQKSLGIMCSSLGKEKEIMASELAKKAHELNEMEELINGFKLQNETLLAKVQLCAAEHKEKFSNSSNSSSSNNTGGGDMQVGNVALQERNKALSEQLLKSLDGYRALKRKYRDAQEENIANRATMEELEMEVAGGIDQIQGFRQRITAKEKHVNIEEQISALERTFEQLNTKISKHVHKKGVNARKPPVLA